MELDILEKEKNKHTELDSVKKLEVSKTVMRFHSVSDHGAPSLPSRSSMSTDAECTEVRPPVPTKTQ